MKIAIHKTLDLDDVIIGNIVVDGFLCSGYSFFDAQAAADKIITGGGVHNACTGARINKTKLIHSIQRFISNETQNDIEIICDNASEIMRGIV